MIQTPLTLLERLRRPGDEAAWARFVDLYAPVLFYWARRCGQDDHDSADLVQEVFVALVQTLPTFAGAGPGRFRGWLRTLLMNKLRDRKRRQARFAKAVMQWAHDDDLPEAAEQFWEVDYQRELARRALELMQAEFTENTWKACWDTVVQGRPVKLVAQELGMSENAVYIARWRVVRRLRAELGDLLD